MYQRGMKWEVYRELEGFKDDIVKGIERRSLDSERIVDYQRENERAINNLMDAVVWEQGLTTNSIDKGFETLAEGQIQTLFTLNRGFTSLIARQKEIVSVFQNSFGAVKYGLEQISGGIASLRSSFDWAMSAILWKLESQEQSLQDILSTLQAPLDAQAKELRQRAEYAYQQGWYSESLSDFLESENKNYQDFAVHHSIGNIYLYHQTPANLEKAKEYYLKAGKYATPRSDYHAALSYMHAGFVCYLLKDDQSAIENSSKAIKLYPTMIEAYYNHAKFAASAGLPYISIPSLEVAIRSDRNYAVKAAVDLDFKNIESDVLKLMELLKSEAKQNAEESWKPFQSVISSYGIVPEDIDIMEAPFKELIWQDTYFAYLDAPSKIPECQIIFEGLRLEERNIFKQEAFNLLQQMDKEISSFSIPEPIHKKLNSESQNLKQLLNRTLRYEGAVEVLEKVKSHKRYFDGLYLKDRNRIIKESLDLIKHIRKEITVYAIHEELHNNLQIDLKRLETIIDNPITFEEAKSVLVKVHKYKNDFDMLRLSDRDRTKKEAFDLIHYLRKEMSKYIMSEESKKILNDEINNLEQILKKTITYDESKSALTLTQKCKEYFDNLRLPDRNNRMAEADGIIKKIENELTLFTNLNILKTKIETHLTDAKKLLVKSVSYDEAFNALNIANKANKCFEVGKLLITIKEQFENISKTNKFKEQIKKKLDKAYSCNDCIHCDSNIMALKEMVDNAEQLNSLKSQHDELKKELSAKEINIRKADEKLNVLVLSVLKNMTELDDGCLVFLILYLIPPLIIMVYTLIQHPYFLSWVGVLIVWPLAVLGSICINDFDFVWKPGLIGIFVDILLIFFSKFHNYFNGNYNNKIREIEKNKKELEMKIGEINNSISQVEKDLNHLEDKLNHQLQNIIMIASNTIK